MRLEKRLLAVARDVAAHKGMTAGEMLEEALLHPYQSSPDGGVARPHDRRTLERIREFKDAHGLDYDTHVSCPARPATGLNEPLGTGRQMNASAGRIACSLVASALAFGVSGCGSEAQSTVQPQLLEWQSVPWSGGTAEVMVLPPSSNAGPGPYPVLLALPWGGGTKDLTLGFLDAYWSLEPARRGYYVVGLAGRASDLADVGDELVPSLLSWIEAELDADMDEIVLAGASNGGRGIFYAAAAQPGGFAAMVGLPGVLDGHPNDADALTDVPVWLLVGEFDAGWVQASQETVELLTSRGIDATLTIVPDQGHVLLLSPATLMDWIDEALGR